jgi:hypothetical protein
MTHGVEGAADGGFEKWVMGAAEEESFGFGCSGQGFGEVDFQDFVGDGVVDPALFDQRDQEGAGFFVGLEAKGVKSVGVGAGLDGGGGGQDKDVVRGFGGD